MTNIAKCNLSAPVQQQFNVNGSYNSIVDVTLNQQANFFSRCVFGTDNVAEVATTIQNQLDANASASGGFDLSVLLTFLIIGIIVVAVVIGLIFGIRFATTAIPDNKWKKELEMYKASQQYSSGNQATTATTKALK